MALVSRASLPEEFFDITSARMLVQPEPQYIHAAMVKAALASELNLGGSALGLPLPNRNVGDDGVDMGLANADLRLMLSDPLQGMYSSAITVVAELANAPGMTVRMNRPKFADTTYTFASREISGGTISTTPVAYQSEQVPITIKRYAGPLGAAGGSVQPFGVDRFEASRSLHKLFQTTGLQLVRDFDKFVDKATIALLDSASTVLWPNGFTADNQLLVAGDAPMDMDTLARAESTMDAASIPKFANGKRVCVLHPRQIQQLKNDGQFAKYAEFYPAKNPLFQSYVATIGNLDIFSSSNLTQQAGPPVIYQGQIFAPGAIGWGVGEAPRVAASTADNYGEQALLIWLWYAGAALLDNRFAISIHTD